MEPANSDLREKLKEIINQKKKHYIGTSEAKKILDADYCAFSQPQDVADMVNNLLEPGLQTIADPVNLNVVCTALYDIIKAYNDIINEDGIDVLMDDSKIPSELNRIYHSALSFHGPMLIFNKDFFSSKDAEEGRDDVVKLLADVYTSINKGKNDKRGIMGLLSLIKEMDRDDEPEFLMNEESDNSDILSDIYRKTWSYFEQKTQEEIKSAKNSGDPRHEDLSGLAGKVMNSLPDHVIESGASLDWCDLYEKCKTEAHKEASTPEWETTLARLVRDKAYTNSEYSRDLALSFSKYHGFENGTEALEEARDILFERIKNEHFSKYREFNPENNFKALMEMKHEKEQLLEQFYGDDEKVSEYLFQKAEYLLKHPSKLAYEQESRLHKAKILYEIIGRERQFLDDNLSANN